MKLAQMRGEVQKTRQTVKKFRSMKDKTASGVSNVSFIGDQSHSKAKHNAESSDSEEDIINLRQDQNLTAVVKRE